MPARKIVPVVPEPARIRRIDRSFAWLDPRRHPPHTPRLAPGPSRRSSSTAACRGRSRVGRRSTAFVPRHAAATWTPSWCGGSIASAGRSRTSSHRSRSSAHSASPSSQSASKMTRDLRPAASSSRSSRRWRSSSGRSCVSGCGPEWPARASAGCGSGGRSSSM